MALHFFVLLAGLAPPIIMAFNPTWFPSEGVGSCSNLREQVQPFPRSGESYASSEEVGLGGGIEIAMPKAFCSEMLRVIEFVDSCEQLLRAVRRATRLWSDFHPYLYFVVRMGPPRLGEVVLTAGRAPSDKQRLASARKIDKSGRHEINFNTENCFHAPLSVPEIDVQDISSDKSAKRCHGAVRHNFEVVLAHELGHVLGIGHPGENGILLGPTSSQPPKLDQHVPISVPNVCSGLDIHWQEDCSTIRDIGRCRATSGCRSKEWMHNLHSWAFTCERDLQDALMAPQVSRSSSMFSPSENDLAALYFLYPDKRRQRRWGTKPIPLMAMSRTKLQSMLKEATREKSDRSDVDAEHLSQRHLAEFAAQYHPWHPLTADFLLEDVSEATDGSQASLGRDWTLVKIAALVIGLTVVISLLAWSNKSPSVVSAEFDFWECPAGPQRLKEEHRMDMVENEDNEDENSSDEGQLHAGATVKIIGISGFSCRRAVVLHECRDPRWAGSGRWAVESEGSKFAAKPENLVLIASAADQLASKILVTNLYGRVCERQSKAAETALHSGATHVCSMLPAMIASKATHCFPTDISPASCRHESDMSPANRTMTEAAAKLQQHLQANLPGEIEL